MSGFGKIIKALDADIVSKVGDQTEFGLKLRSPKL